MFEKKLKSLLETHNLSVAELAKRTGVPKTNIQSWLSGASPNVIQVDKVAAYFNMTVDELVFDRKAKSSLESILSEIHVHEGIYKVQISKLIKGSKDES